jgi:D-glycero-D-manno-heptose 1,7-bisphosphate phosphatase
VQGAKAAFLDRDGVINRDRDYVYKTEDFEFLDGVFEACRRLETLGYRIIIVTNQSGIGRGYFSEADFNRLTDWMVRRFLEEGVTITGTYFCPDHPVHGVGVYKRDSGHRKPGPKMILDAANDHGLDLQASFIAGDKASDILAGRAAGVGRCFFIGDAEVLPADLRDVKSYGNLLDLVRQEFKQQ